MNSKGMIKGICILTMVLLFVSANAWTKTNNSSITKPSATGNIDEGSGIPALVKSEVLNAVRGGGDIPKVSAINHGGFGGAPYAKVDASAVTYYKAQAALIAAGGYVTDEQYLTMEATLVSSDGGSTYLTDRGGCIYTQTVITGLQTGDIVEVDNNSFYNDGSGWYSFWDQAPYWVLISAYTHNSTQTINNWLIYFESDGMGGYTMVIGSGEYDLALWDDDLTTIIGDQFRLTRDVRVWQGATLQNPLISSRGYTYSTTGITGGTQIASSSLTTPDYTYIGASNVWVDASWSSNHNGDLVSGHVYGQDAFDNIQQGINGTSGGTVNVAAGTYGADSVTGEGAYITNDGLSLIGESETGTIIDGAIGGVGSSGSYWPKGIHVQANNVTVKNFTIQGFNGDGITTGGYGIVHRDWAHDTPGEGYIFYDGCTVDNVTVQNCYSAIYALCFTHLTVKNCIVSNNSADGMFIARGSDYATIYDNTVTNSGDHGIWVGICWLGLRPSHHATIYNNTIDGAEEGGISFDGSDDALIHHNTITNVAGAGWSVGALNLKDGPTNVEAHHNAIFNNSGTWGGYSGTGNGVGIDGAASNINLYYNSIYGNSGLGVYNGSSKGSKGLVMAENNYWGSWDGPLDNVGTNEATATQCYDVSTMKNTIAEISPSLGNAVSEGVDYCPWTSSGVAFSPDTIIYHCSGDFSFDVEIGYAIQDMDGAHFVIEYPAQLVLSSVTKASANYTLFYTLTDNSSGNDILTVDLGVLTGSQDGPATLFTVALNGSVDLCSGYQIQVTDVDLRDSENNPIPVPLASPIELMADCSDPDIVVNSPASGGYYNVAPVLDLTASDNCDLDAVYYQMDGCLPGGWLSIATGLSGTTYNNASWTVPGFGGLSEAEHCVRFKVIDDAARANSDSCSYTWCFTKDVTAPPPPTNLTAQPAHNKVKLAWNNATSDFHHTVVMRTDWYSSGHGYPEYDDNNAEGPYPTDTSCCDLVYSGTGTSLTDVSDISNTTRDVYHYAAFTVDAAGNVSSASAGARSTSYWLGDVAGGGGLNDYDGYVYYQDLTILSTTYWKSHGEGGYQNQFDIGPTATGSPKGIPTTDNIINFEDLSIFAINYDAVNPYMKVAPIFVEEGVNGPLGLQLLMPPVNGLRASKEFKVGVLLRNNPNVVKGIHFVVPYDATQLQFVRAEKSTLLQGSPAPVFFDGRDVDHRVDVSLALLGGEIAIGGSGEIATIIFRPLQAEDISLAFSLVDLRDSQNRKLLCGEEVAQTQLSPDVPSSYGLSQNYPNTFNPETQISYQLPQAGEVSLKVYNIKGELVRTLVDGYKGAGYHTVKWDGRNEKGEEVASGVYFYRLVTNDFTSTRKMIMLK